jgi:hypothetical protein
MRNCGLVMPRYYIDIRSHFAINEDTDAVDLPDHRGCRGRSSEDWREATGGVGWAATRVLKRHRYRNRR